MCKGLCANGFQDQNMVETPLLSLRLALATPPVTISCVRQIDVFKWFQRAWHEAISFCVASMSSSNANMSRALMVQEKWSTLFLQGLKTLDPEYELQSCQAWGGSSLDCFWTRQECLERKKCLGGAA